MFQRSALVFSLVEFVTYSIRLDLLFWFHLSSKSKVNCESFVSLVEETDSFSFSERIEDRSSEMLNFDRNKSTRHAEEQMALKLIFRWAKFRLEAST